MDSFIESSLVTEEHYLRFLDYAESVTIEGKTIKLKGHQRPKTLQPPDDFTTETTTFWSFEKRGKWATHRASYRGNWAPQIARNLILRYSDLGDTVLDQMAGGGTTLVECKLNGRRGIGVDINRDALMLTMDALNFDMSARSAEAVAPATADTEPPTITLYEGDARNLDRIPDDSIDLVATHPPYANIIRYSARARSKTGSPPGDARTGSIPDDLSNVRGIAQYVDQMRLVAAEAYRVLKPDHYCAILMGDTRRVRHYTPIAFRVMQAFLDVDFILKEDIIKAQWHTQTEGLWSRLSRDKNFLLIMHEHLFIFRKPAPNEDTRPYAESKPWW